MKALFRLRLWCLIVKQTFTSPLTRLHYKACTVYAACHSSTNVSQSQHAAPRNNESQQFKQNTLRPIGTERTDHPKHSVFMLWICACRLHPLTCMGCMHAVLSRLFVVLSVCIIKCTASHSPSLYVCVCVCVCV